jgi:hypothetical protein
LIELGKRTSASQPKRWRKPTNVIRYDTRLAHTPLD